MPNHKTPPILFTTTPHTFFTKPHHHPQKCIKSPRQNHSSPTTTLTLTNTDDDKPEFNPSYAQVQKEITRRWSEGQKLPGLEQRGSVAGEYYTISNLEDIYVSSRLLKEIRELGCDKYGGKEELGRLLGVEVARLIYGCYGEVKGVFGVIGRGWKGYVCGCVMRELVGMGWSGVVWMEGLEEEDGMRRWLEEGGVETCEFVPRTLEGFFDVFLEGLFGVGWDGGFVRDECADVHHMLCEARKPVVCLEVPAGWDVDGGIREVDRQLDEFVKPEILVSFGAPSLGLKNLGYGYHYVVGGFVDKKWGEDNGIGLVDGGEDGLKTVLIKRDPIKFGFAPGEIYGKPGKYMATLFNKNPRRTWVGDDELDELDWIAE